MTDATFADWDCHCDHGPYDHDDGFGCTVKDCDCLAGWVLSLTWGRY